MKLRNILIAAAGLTLATAAASAASAHTPWQDHHGRRVEVNHRLGHRNHSIHEARRHGDISYREARFLHHRDHSIRVQERRFASLHDGHISRGEQARLNHEENGVRHHI